MNSHIENYFAMDCVREDFARLFISMDGKSNEARKSCQNDDVVKKKTHWVFWSGVSSEKVDTWETDMGWWGYG